MILSKFSVLRSIPGYIYIFGLDLMRKRLMFLRSSKLILYATSFCPVLGEDDDLWLLKKKLAAHVEKSNLVGYASFTSWRDQGCTCPGHYTVLPEAELVYSGPGNMMTVFFKVHFKSAAIVNMGTIPLLLPVLCIHSSPGFCPKVPGPSPHTLFDLVGFCRLWKLRSLHRG